MGSVRGGRRALGAHLAWLRGWMIRTVSGWAFALAACGPPSGDAQDTSFDDLFVEVSRVEFEESANDPIVSIEYVGERPNGGYIVPDRHAGKVRLFDQAGREDLVLGTAGDGPGELNEPAGAVELSDGRVAVVQRANPRLTIFIPNADPILEAVPGQYGFWATAAEGGFVAGVATQDTRFARFDEDGSAASTFGVRDPVIADTPFWIFFARDHAAVLGETIAVSTSLFPTVRLFSADGDSIGSFGHPPPAWEPVSEPPVSDLSAPGSRERLEEWARSFTIVGNLATVSDSLLVVEYGRYDPREADPYFSVPTTVDVYNASGDKLAEGISLPGPVVGGGAQLLVLVSEPPNSWTVSALEWRGANP